MGQASILNTFSHFHTPLLISLTRMFIGLAAGLVMGLVLLQLMRWAVQIWRGWGRTPAPPAPLQEAEA